MRQIKLIVEGQTERIFVEKLVEAIAGVFPYRIEFREFRGGVIRVSGFRANSDQPDVEIELFDVGNDEQVRTFIEDRLNGFLHSGATGVYGLRDVFAGSNRQDVDVEVNRRNDLDLSGKYGIPVKIFLAKREIEAWFLSCPDFLRSIHDSLTVPFVRDRLGIDLSVIEIEDIDRPASFLNSILDLVGLRYRKRKGETHSIISHFDFACLYLVGRDRTPSLGEFLDVLDGFFEPAA